MLLQPHSFIGVVVQVHVRDVGDVSQRIWIDTKIVILAGDLNGSRRDVPHRMISPVMTEGQLKGVTPESTRQQLMPETDSERRNSCLDDRTNCLGRTRDHLGISGAVRQEDSVWRHGNDVARRRSSRDDRD